MKDLQNLRDHYDTTDQSAAFEDAVVETEPVDNLLVSTPIRLSTATLDKVRALARESGVPATTLMREWIEARVGEGSDALVIAVTDLERFIAVSARRAS